MFISGSSGNVGIGTTTPNNDLQVGASSFSNNDFAAGNSNGSIAINSNNGSSYVYSSQRLDLLSGGVGMTILTNGNVGIGAASSTVKLRVNGDVESSNMIRATGGYVGTLSGGGSEISYVGGNAYLSGYDRTASSYLPVRIVGSSIEIRHSDANPDIFVNSSGNVGFNTNNPTTAKLVIVPTGTYSIDAGGGRIGNVSSSIDTDAASVAYVKAIVAGTSTVPTVGYWTANGTNIYNSNSGNVGIGTTAPGANLEVANLTGAIVNLNTLDSDVQPGDVLGSLVFTARNDGSGDGDENKGKIRVESTGAYVGGPSDPSKMVFSLTNGVGVLSDYLTIKSGGNVGIGTTTPTTALQVNGTVTASSFSGPLAGTVNATNVSAGNFAANTGGGNFNFPGNVGIGTAPGVPLDVAGQGRFVSGTFPVIQATRTSVSPGGVLLAAVNYELTATNPAAGNGVASYFKAPNAAGTSTWAGLFGGGLSTITAGSEIGFIGFKAAYNGADPGNGNYGLKLIATSAASDNAIFSGNVGIGAAPGAKLDIIGGVGPYLALKMQSSGGSVDSVYSGQVASIYGYIGSGYYNNSWNWRTGNTAASNILFSHDGSMQFNTDTGLTANIDYLPTTRMTILNNGNVGINTGAPGTYKLNVNGDTNITGTLNVTGAVTGGSMTGTVNAGNVSSGNFASNTGGGNFSFPGNVGIGTTNPGAKLEVNGDILVANTSKIGFRYTAGDNSLYSYMAYPSGGPLTLAGGLWTSTPTQEAISFKTQGVAAAMSILNNGNVGIGTTTPAALLQVTGGAYNTPVIPLILQNKDTSIRLASTIGMDFMTMNASNATRARILAGGEIDYDSRSSYLSFYTNDSSGALNERMRINSLGNVGIGTTTPTEAKLVINAGAGMALKAYGNGIFTGTLQTQTGSDFAEEFATTKDLETGTVVVMDDNGYKTVRPCNQSYDKTVVGIVSNNPSIIAGRVNSKHKAIIAMMGVVKVKVSDVNGEISKGDLLTTSGIYGYAMKSENSKPGTIIGKALENLDGKTGEINVLVNLQ